MRYTAGAFFFCRSHPALPISFTLCNTWQTLVVDSESCQVVAKRQGPKSKIWGWPCHSKPSCSKFIYIWILFSRMMVAGTTCAIGGEDEVTTGKPHFIYLNMCFSLYVLYRVSSSIDDVSSANNNNETWYCCVSPVSSFFFFLTYSKHFLGFLFH